MISVTVVRSIAASQTHKLCSTTNKILLHFLVVDIFTLTVNVLSKIFPLLTVGVIM